MQRFGTPTQLGRSPIVQAPAGLLVEELHRPIREEDRSASRLSQRFDPRGDVDRVTDDREFESAPGGADVPGYDRAGVGSDPDA